MWYEVLSTVSINLTLLQYVTSCTETCCLHFQSRQPSEWTLTLEVTGSSRTLVPTLHTAWHHNSGNTAIRLWGAVASFQNLVELADKLDTQLTQERNFMFSYLYICCACWARKCKMKSKLKAVEKQPLSEKDRNGRTTLKWLSGKCAMGALTKFWICYKIVCHNVCTVNIQLQEEMLQTVYALESRQAGLFVSHCTTWSKSIRPQYYSYGS
jgi:hypothetical protein